MVAPRTVAALVGVAVVFFLGVYVFGTGIGPVLIGLGLGLLVGLLMAMFRGGAQPQFPKRKR